MPLTLLKTAENHPMLIELKNGDTYNGRLVSCNLFMNICLKDVICTSKDGDRFWKLPECYIRGNSIKYLRIPDEVIDLVAEEEQKDRTCFAVDGVAFEGLCGWLSGLLHSQCYRPASCWRVFFSLIPCSLISSLSFPALLWCRESSFQGRARRAVCGAVRWAWGRREGR